MFFRTADRIFSGVGYDIRYSAISPDVIVPFVQLDNQCEMATIVFQVKTTLKINNPKLVEDTIDKGV